MCKNNKRHSLQFSCIMNKIVILSTHIVSDIEAIADEVLLMKQGKIVLHGTVPELVQKAEGKVWRSGDNVETCGGSVEYCHH